MSRLKISCEDVQIKMMGLLDNELNEQLSKQIFDHLEVCPDCKKKYDSFVQLKKDTSDMKFKKLPEMYWDDYWTHVYNRIERGFSWILVSLGAMILLVYGSYEVMHEFYLDPENPLLIKIGAGILTVGMIVLFVSVLREKLMIRKIDKYRSIER